MFEFMGILALLVISAIYICGAINRFKMVFYINVQQMALGIGLIP